MRRRPSRGCTGLAKRPRCVRACVHACVSTCVHRFSLNTRLTSLSLSLLSSLLEVETITLYAKGTIEERIMAWRMSLEEGREAAGTGTGKGKGKDRLAVLPCDGKFKNFSREKAKLFFGITEPEEVICLDDD